MAKKKRVAHIHILIIFTPEESLKTVDDYDGAVCAELPPLNHPLQEKVLKPFLGPMFSPENRVLETVFRVKPCLRNGFQHETVLPFFFNFFYFLAMHRMTLSFDLTGSLLASLVIDNDEQTTTKLD